nr:L698 [uncultured bacterium]
MELHALIPAILPYLTPSEQAVYLRLWHLSRGEGTCAVRYDDLAHSAHISRSTLKRVLKTLTRRKLITVTLQAKRTSLFAVFERPLTTKKVFLGFDRPRLYDLFTEEDRSLFLTSKRSLPPVLLKQFEAEVDGDPYQLDLLIFRQVFGPDRQKRYAQLIGGHFDP